MSSSPVLGSTLGMGLLGGEKKKRREKENGATDTAAQNQLLSRLKLTLVTYPVQSHISLRI